MSRVIFSMTVSLDGFTAGPGDDIGWTVPTEELHRFHNEQTRELGAHLCGRRLYETMVFWETAERDPDLPDAMREFAPIWKALPKVVFSRTLESVEGNTRLAEGDVAAEIARAREETEGDIGIGGPGLAAEATRLGLIDEYRLFVTPAVLGGGTPYFPALDERVDLELVETRTFEPQTIYLRYRRV